MGERVFKTLDQQIDILTDRGLNISSDEIEATKDFLLKNNYYRISGYSLTLRDHDAFYENATFQLFSISKLDLQNTIAEHFGLKNNNKVDILREYLRGLTVLRNFCAHGRRRYNRLFVRKPTLNSKEKKLLLRDENGVLDNAHLFGFILEIKRILPTEEFNELKESIVKLSKKYPFVSMKYYGFCKNWENLL